ncbi:putative membrane protein [Labrenzia sp. EL_126]|nr:putative membrane protein [Labrenzia sp. EL_126]
MVQHAIAYIATALVFLAVDYVWLSQVATRFYFDRIGHLLMDKPNMAAAGAFYIIYVVGIVVFAVAPALKSESLATAVIYGAMFGFFTYATYDVTNYATLRNWPVIVTVVDVSWGTVLSAFSAGMGYTLTRMVS